MSAITSRQHPVCKLVRSLHDAKGRRKSRLFEVEGGNSVAAALRARWPLQRLLVTSKPAGTEWADLGDSLGVPHQTIDQDLMPYLSEALTDVDVIAIAELQPRPLEGELSGLVLVLDGIGDPGNVGTLIRTADAVGASAVIATEQAADAYSPKVIRATAGSLFNLPPVTLPDDSPAAVARLLRSQSLPVVLAEAHHGADCFRFNWPPRCALVLGHETHGVAPEFETIATGCVTIPMYGKAESLNVASAGAVLCYAWRNSIR